MFSLEKFILHFQIKGSSVLLIVLLLRLVIS